MLPIRPSRVAAALALAAVAVLTGCAERLKDPALIVTPYEDNRLWGVAPFSNESGASVVDGAAIADSFMMQAQQVDRIDVVPVNRVIAAMRAGELSEVRSYADAQTLMRMLGLDGLVVGTVTAYDPYRPMKLGLAVGLDPRALTRSTRGEPEFGEVGRPGPVAAAAGVFDAANHQTIQRLEAYAAGRVEPESALGQDIYLVSMEWYTRFVCHRLLDDLLAGERTETASAAEDAR
jgi:hypothetical protein